MKKIIVTLAALVLAAGASYAQDLAEIAEIQKQGKEAFENGEKAEALNLFKQALELATAAGDAGAEIVSQCKGVIPTISLSLAKEAFNAQDFETAAEKFKEAADIAEKYEAYDVADEALALVPKALFGNANKLLNEKNYAAAAEAYKKVIEVDGENGNAWLRLGMALNASGATEEAVEAFKTAGTFGKEKDSVKQISNIYLKQAAAALKTKNYTAAVEAANKVNEIAENPQAYQIAGQASQIAGKNADAIKYFEKYLEIAPDAKNAAQIAFTVGALYQTAKNNAKAKEYYSMAVDDPKFGAEAKKMLSTLK